MIDLLARAAVDALKKYAVPAAIAGGAAVVAWIADQQVKKRTGKHIHEHAVDYVKSLWNRLKNRANQYLDTHPDVKEVYIKAVNVAACIVRAKNKGFSRFKLNVFGKGERITDQRIFEEEVPLDQSYKVQKQAVTEPTLAVRV